MARAIVTRPRVLLLDEPLSASTRRCGWKCRSNSNASSARSASPPSSSPTTRKRPSSSRPDRHPEGRPPCPPRPPRQVYNDPQDAFTARFLGEANLIPGTPEPGGLRLADGTLIPGLTQPLLALRPEFLTLSHSTPDTPLRLRCRLRQKIFAGAMGTCLLDWQGQTLKATGRDADFAALTEGPEVWASWPADRMIALPAPGTP